MISLSQNVTNRDILCTYHFTKASDMTISNCFLKFKMRTKIINVHTNKQCLRFMLQWLKKQMAQNPFYEVK